MITPHQVLQLLPEYNDLTETTRNNVFQFVDTKLQKLQFKLTTSPYLPRQREDRLHLNHNPTRAIHEWLRQFPDEFRLGALTAALGLSYITHLEIGQLLDIVLSQFIEQVEGVAQTSRHGSYHLLPKHIKQRIRIIPLSEFAQFPDFIRRANISGTADTNCRPAETLQTFVFNSFQELRSIADHGEHTPYPDVSESAVKLIVNTLLDNFLMIVEDNSYSGTTATSDLHRLHQLTDVMFTSFLPQLKTAGYNLPKMYLLMPVATASAVKTIADRLSISEQSYFPVPPIVGHTFLRERDSFEAGLPEALQPLQAVVPTNVSLSERVYKTLEYFHDTYAYKYWESETAIATRNAINKKDVLYGYKNGGYAIATYSNCPNNSMPLLWYPHSESDNSQFIALFSRVERRLEHFSERSDRLADHIEITKRDSNHNLRSYLRGFYEKFLRS